MIQKAFNQWKFVHGLIKSMVLNTITSMVYLRQSPDGEVYITKCDDLRDYDCKVVYVAFMKAFDVLKHKYGFKGGREQQVKIAFNTMMTIPNSDRVYRNFLGDFVSQIRSLTPEEIEAFEENEKGITVEPQQFMAIKRGE